MTDRKNIKKKSVSKKVIKKKSTPVGMDIALKAHFERNARARCRDEFEWSKDVRDEPDIDWIRRPHASDVIGIDIPTEIDPRSRKMIVSKKTPRSCSIEKKPGVYKGHAINPTYIPPEDDEEH